MIVVKEHQNPLLARKEVVFEVLHEKASSPRKTEVKEKIAERLNVNPELIQIVKMETKTNTWKTTGTAYIYPSPEKARLLTPKYMVLRNLSKEEKAKLKEKKPEKKPVQKKK